MKKDPLKTANFIIYIHAGIVIGIIFFFWLIEGSPLYYKIEYFVNAYFLDGFGVYSKSRPVLSKVLMNYMAFLAPITAFIFYYIGYDSQHNIKNKLFGFFLFLAIFIIATYFLYFNHTYYVGNEKTFKALRGESIIAYFSLTILMFAAIPISAPELLNRIIPLKTFKKLISKSNIDAK